MFCHVLVVLSLPAADKPTDPPEVKALMRQRVALLKRGSELAMNAFKSGRGSMDTVTRAMQDLEWAELALADTREKKREIYLRSFLWAVRVDERTVDLFSGGSVDEGAYIAARNNRLIAEIKLRRAGGKPPRDVKPPREPRRP